MFVPTPVGNRADITLRALEVLKQADIIACEDTRHSRPLLQFYQIDSKKLISLHSHNEQSRAEEILQQVQQGSYVAVISDAGTPMISDPGHRLLQQALQAEIAVEVLPGPTALIPALAASGLASDRFSFQGFLPQKSGRKKRELEQALKRSETSIFYESPHRLTKTLQALVELAPQHLCCVAREISKKFESFHRGSAESLLAEFTQKTPKGEIVFLIAGTAQKTKPSSEELC